MMMDYLLTDNNIIKITVVVLDDEILCYGIKNNSPIYKILLFG